VPTYRQRDPRDTTDPAHPTGKAETVATMPHPRDPARLLTFTGKCEYSGQNIDNSGPHRRIEDLWTFTVTTERGAWEKRQTIARTFTYRTGTGHRQPPKFPYNARPVRPPVLDLFDCLSLDCEIAMGMPANTANAMDHLAEEFGREDKPSDMLRLVEALRENLDKVRALAGFHGVTVEEFAAYFNEQARDERAQADAAANPDAPTT
jgi:hypothetical protein